LEWFNKIEYFQGRRERRSIVLREKKREKERISSIFERKIKEKSIGKERKKN